MNPARIQISRGARKRRVAAALLAWVAGSGVWACSLNPQPIPPGFADDTTASDAGRGADVALGPANGADAGGGGDHDSAPLAQDAGRDGGADAGDAARHHAATGLEPWHYRGV